MDLHPEQGTIGLPVNLSPTPPLLSLTVNHPSSFSSSISIYNATTRPSAVFSSVPAISILKIFIPTSTVSVTSSSSDYPTYSSLCLTLALSNILWPTACVAPSIPSSRPDHNWRYPHAIFAWSPPALITIFPGPGGASLLFPWGAPLEFYPVSPCNMPSMRNMRTRGGGGRPSSQPV